MARTLGHWLERCKLQVLTSVTLLAIVELLECSWLQILEIIGVVIRAKSRVKSDTISRKRRGKLQRTVGSRMKLGNSC